MIDGGKDIMRSLAKGIGSGASFLVKELTHVLNDVTEFISNPGAYLAKAKAAGGGAKGFGAEIISSIAENFNDPKGEKLKAFGDAFVNFAMGIGKQLKKVMDNPAVQKVLLDVGGPLLTAMIGKNLLSLAPTILSKFGPQLARLLSTGLGGSLAAVGGIALAGVALVNVNKKLDEFETGIDRRRDPASKKIGAYGASLLQGLTLGLVPDNVAVMLGNKIAELSDVVFDAIKDKMGGPFVNKLKTYFSSYINFLSSVGGLIGAIFSGDSGAISKSAEEVGDRLVKLLGSAFDFLITEFPKLLIKIPAVLDQVIGSILEGLGGALTKLGDKLGIFGLGIKGIGILVMGLGGVLKDLGKFFDGVYDKIKDFDITKIINDQMYGLKKSLIDTAQSILDTVPGPILTMMGLNEKGRMEMREILKKNSEEMKKNFLEQNRIALEAKKAEEDRQKSISDATNKDIGSKAGSIAIQAAQPSAVAAQAQIDVQALMSQKKTLEENLKELTNFANTGVIKNISDSIPKASTALTDFNEKLSKSSIESTIGVTQGVVKSINDLNTILGDGNAGAIKVGEKLQRFANNSGLGKNGTYEIKNKGITLKLDLKVTMDAGEVEKAIVLRKESILFDAIEELASTNLNEQNKERLRAVKGGG
jgi:hypothetical protein